MSKISADTLALYKGLPQELRNKVDAKLRTYYRALKAAGMKDDAQADQVMREAIQVVKLEHNNPSALDQWEDDGPPRHYDQYTSPKDL